MLSQVNLNLRFRNTHKLVVVKLPALFNSILSSKLSKGIGHNFKVNVKLWALELRMSQRLVKINCRSISELDNHMSLDWIKMCNLSLVSQFKSRKTEVSRSFLCRSSANIFGIRRESSSHSFRLTICRFRISGMQSSRAASLFGRVKIISQELRLSLSPIVSLSIYSLGLAISLKRLSGISIYRMCNSNLSCRLSCRFSWVMQQLCGIMQVISGLIASMQVIMHITA